MTNCPNCGQPLGLHKLKVKSLDKLGQGATFQNTADVQPFNDSHIVEQRSFWASDGITYAVAGVFSGGVVLLFSWWYDLNGGVVAALTTLIIGVGPHILKIILHAPPKLPPPPGKTTITIEQQSADRKHWLLADLDFITNAQKFYKTMAEVDRQQKWTRAICTSAGLTQGQHAKLQQRFIEMGYLMPLPNNANGFRLTIQGRRAIKRIISFGEGRGLLKKESAISTGMSDHWVEKKSGKSNW